MSDVDYFDYAEAQDDADLLIEEFAGASPRACWIIQKGAETGDEWNPTIGASVNTAVKAVETEWSQGQVDGTRIRANDKRYLVSAKGLSITPTVAMQFNVGGALVAGEITGGKTYELVQLKPLDPAGTPVFYDAQVR